MDKYNTIHDRKVLEYSRFGRKRRWRFTGIKTITVTLKKESKDQEGRLLKINTEWPMPRTHMPAYKEENGMNGYAFFTGGTGLKNIPTSRYTKILIRTLHPDDRSQHKHYLLCMGTINIKYANITFLIPPKAYVIAISHDQHIQHST